jgi:hypothetical protein
MAASSTERSWRVLEFLWRFNARSDGNLNVAVLLRRRSEGGKNNFVTEDVSVIKESVARGGFSGNGSIAWTSAVSHVERTSNVFKVTMKLQTFLFQMLVTSRISV